MPTAEEEGYVDKDMTCDNASCGNPFVWTAGEQRFYHQVGNSPPELCEPCRIQRRNQQPVLITCSACEEDYTYSEGSIRYHRRNVGKFEDVKVCKPCLLDPQRAKRLKEEQEERQKEKERKDKLPFSDTLAYYLHSKGKGDGRFDDDIDLDSMTVHSDVELFDILSDPDSYREIGDRDHGDVWTHIMRSDHKWDERLGTDDEEVVFSEAAAIAESTDSHTVIQCKIRGSDRWAKFDTTSSWVLIIRNNENPPPEYRLVTTYIATAEEASEWIKGGIWILN